MSSHLSYFHTTIIREHDGFKEVCLLLLMSNVTFIFLNFWNTPLPKKNWQLLNQLRKWHNFWTIFSICFTTQNRIGTNKAYHNLFYFNLSMFLVSSDLCFQTKCHLVQILLSLSEIWASCRQCHLSQRACTKAMVPKVTTCNSSSSEVSIRLK